MLGTNLISKNYSLKSSIKEIGYRLIFSELKQCRKSKNARFYSKTLTSGPYKQLSVKRLSNAVQFSSLRYNSAQATVEVKTENVHKTKSYFEKLLHDRKIQAHRSFLIEVAKKEDIPFAVTHCQKYGAIENAYSYSGENENGFLLLEFCNENAGKELLMNCKCKNIVDAFPVCSRLIGYEKIYETSLSEIKIIEEGITKSSLQPGASMSEVIQDIYSTEKLTELDIRLRYFFCSLIKDSISYDFPHCDVIPFGSSVNGIGKRGCDLDVMVRLYPEQVNGNGEFFFLNKTCLGKHKNYQQKAISGLGEYIRAFFPGISSIEKIMFARVPILKMNHRILKIECDLSINNMSAVYMSDVIYFCGEIDARIRPLMYAVKKWAKEAGITNPSPGQWISNFGLINLVIFFLQNRPYPVLPALNDAFVIIGEENSFDFGVQYFKSIEEWKNRASLNEESLAVLLKEFLTFLATEAFEENILSLMTGKKRPMSHKDESPLWIQYAFDEGLNITRNISSIEFEIMREKARISARHLENNLKQKMNAVKDFSILLGIPSVTRIGVKSQKINVNSLIDNKVSRHKVVRHRIF